jgi:HSP20 family protein
MAQTPVEVKKTIAARTPDAWHSFRGELDRLFDRFAGSFSLPSFRRMFDVEPAWRTESAFSFPSPSVDVTEDGKAYKITAELPGLEQKNIDISVSGDMLTLARSRCPTASIATGSPPIWRRAC